MNEDNFVWEDPPPAHDGRRKWGARLEKVAASPGRWARFDLIGSAAARGAAAKINQGVHGSFQATTRGTSLYVRYTPDGTE